MLRDEISRLYRQFRLLHYRKLFGRIRERDGSLSATEAFAADVIFLLDEPTVTALADTLGISQPNATYKVNNLTAKGYVHKTASEDDRRECRLQVSEKFHSYYDSSDSFLQPALEKLRSEYTEEELKKFETMLASLNEAVADADGGEKGN
ncbi:MAG: MarR family transcriptional regulator [Clostridiales bacterium]|nr:MarR family transcriptional regulator [Candidatus Apopatocola equi]MCQ2439221.1 MarR family transcriptional regulator [Oscillospiraceae bacterium]